MTNNGHDTRAMRLSTDPIMYGRIRRLMDGVVENVRNAYLSRESRITAGRNELDPRRNIFDECGFPDTSLMTPNRWQDLHERDAIAGRINEAMAKEAWQVQPAVFEKQAGKVTTATERGIKQVAGALHSSVVPSYFDDDEGSALNEVLQRATVLCGVGRYGVVYYGLDDGLPPSRPVAGLEELGSIPSAEVVRNERYEMVPGPNGKAQPLLPKRRGGEVNYPRYALNYDEPLTQGRKLGYVRVFTEALAYVTRWEANRNSPRYGQPVSYRLTFNDPSTPMLGIGLPLSTEECHWTRVLHIADTFHTAPPGGSDMWALPRVQPVLNHVLSAGKIYGSSGEGYWKAVFSYLFLETHPQLGGDVEIDDDALKDMMEEMINGLQRYGILSGMSGKAVGPTLSDPTSHLNIQLEAICIKLGMPMRIFKGSERGELASTQDDSAWNDRVKQFESGWITSSVIKPFYNRLVLYGVIPRPQQSLKVEWPDITSMSALEKAQVAQARMMALTQYLNGGGGQAMTLMDFYTKEFGLTEEDAASRVKNVMGEASDAYADEATIDDLDYVPPESVEGEGEDAPAAEGEPGAEQPAANARMCWGKPCEENHPDAGAGFRKVGGELRAEHPALPIGQHVSIRKAADSSYEVYSHEYAGDKEATRTETIHGGGVFSNMDLKKAKAVAKAVLTAKAAKLQDRGERAANARMCWGKPCDNPGAQSLKEMHEAGPESMSFEKIDSSLKDIAQLKGQDFNDAVKHVLGEERAKSVIGLGSKKRAMAEIEETFKGRLESHQRTQGIGAKNRKARRKFK